MTARKKIPNRRGFGPFSLASHHQNLRDLSASK